MYIHIYIKFYIFTVLSSELIKAEPNCPSQCQSLGIMFMIKKILNGYIKCDL